MKRLLPALAFALLAACSSGDVTGPTTDLRVYAEQPSYTFTGEPISVLFYVVNDSEGQIMAASCGNVVLGVLQQRQGGTWTTVSSSPCPAVQNTDPIVVFPTGYATGLVHIDRAGTYRILVPDPRTTPQEPVGISKTFEVK